MDSREILEVLGRLDERTEQILKHLDKINGTIYDHEKYINEHGATLERHSSYFRIMGTLIAILLSAFLTALFSILTR